MPDDIEFATKPALAAGMLTRALRRRGPGAVGGRRRGLRRRPRPARRVRSPADRLRAGHRLRPPRPAPRPDRCAPTSSPPACPDGPGSGSRPEPGAKGQRYYDWAWITLTSRTAPTTPTPACWWLLVRRHRDTGELAFYRCYSPQLVPLRELVRVAGRRWTVEESFQAGKGLAGLDEHQVRRWTSWRRWTLLAMLAHALLAVIAAPNTPTGPHPPG